jgi:hypothetical protein
MWRRNERRCGMWSRLFNSRQSVKVSGRVERRHEVVTTKSTLLFPIVLCISQQSQRDTIVCGLCCL